MSKILSGIRVHLALYRHQKGRTQEALEAYERLYEAGILRSSYLLPYSVLLLRRGRREDYERVLEALKKAQKARDLNPERRQQLLMNYAVAAWKTGDLPKALSLLEASHREGPCGLTYGALGYLYVEAGEAEKALAYNLEAVAYDEEDPVPLDNLGQTYYRLLGDREKAREYFERAHRLKPGQIDTLYFLSRYDLDRGDREAALVKLRQALQGRFSPLNHLCREEIEAEIRRLSGETGA